MFSSSRPGIGRGSGVNVQPSEGQGLVKVLQLMFSLQYARDW
jgi:hypothetical protein